VDGSRADLADLAGLAAQGGREAQDKLLRALEGEMISLAYWRLKDVHAAHDVVQESMIEIIRSIGKLDDPARVRPWAMSIVSHNATDAGRRGNPPARAGGPRSEADVDREKVIDALHRLPDEYRQVLVLRHLQGFRYAEIAQTLGLPLGTVRSRIARGDELLTRQLRGVHD
jgi:RNA polymerase sigma-70 factor (ECF subfamily)